MDRIAVFKQKFLRSWFCNRLTVIIQHLNVVNYDPSPFSAYSMQNKVGNGKGSLEARCCGDRQRAHAIHTPAALRLCVNRGIQQRIGLNNVVKTMCLNGGSLLHASRTNYVRRYSSDVLNDSDDNNLDDDDDDVGNVSAGKCVICSHCK